MATRQESVTLYPSGYDSTTYKYASVNSSYPLSNPVGKPSSNTSYAQINLTTGSSAETYIFYKFDTSDIPADATIDSVSCTAKGYISQTNSSRIATRQMQMYSGTSTAKGSATTLSTSASAVTMTAGTWSRSEVNDVRIRLYAKRGTSSTTSTYYLRFYGATLTVTYTVNFTTYTITTNVVGNGSFDPASVTAEDGKDYDFVIRGSTGREELTSLKADGVEVLSQTSKYYDLNAELYSVTLTKSGADYGFTNQGSYYESNNKGQGGNIFSQGSYALCTVNFALFMDCKVKFYVTNWAEAGNDYGMLSNIDQSFSNSKSADSSYYWKGNDKNSSDEQLVEYDMPSGKHTVDVKFIKNYGTNSNNDSIRFRIVIEPKDVVPWETYYYTYTHKNVNHDVNLVATFGSPVPIPKIIFIKKNDVWMPYTRGFKKISGQWIEQSLDELFDENIKYIKFS